MKEKIEDAVIYLNLTKKIFNDKFSIIEKDVLPEKRQVNIENLPNDFEIIYKRDLNEFLVKYRSKTFDKKEKDFIHQEKKYLSRFKESFRENDLEYDIIMAYLNFLEKKKNKSLEYLDLFIKKETKTEKLKKVLSEHGFLSLPLVTGLNNEGQNKLIEKISSSKLPYQIAMFDYLRFIKHLDSKYFQTYKQRNKMLAEWLDSDKEGRAVKGNINSLVRPTKRYTSYLHKEEVRKYYLILK